MKLKMYVIFLFLIISNCNAILCEPIYTVVTITAEPLQIPHEFPSPLILEKQLETVKKQGRNSVLRGACSLIAGVLLCNTFLKFLVFYENEERTAKIVAGMNITMGATAIGYSLTEFKNGFTYLKQARELARY